MDTHKGFWRVTEYDENDKAITKRLFFQCGIKYSGAIKYAERWAKVDCTSCLEKRRGEK